jgi:hypothetical protein
MKIEILKLGLDYTTEQGPYWVKIDGRNVGTAERSHWETEEEAFEFAVVFVRQTMRLKNHDTGRDEKAK